MPYDMKRAEAIAAKKQKILDKYPLLYADKDKSMRETCMCWGLEVGEGWLDIIDEYSAKIEKEIKKYIEENEGQLTCAICFELPVDHIEGDKKVDSEFGSYTINKHTYTPYHPKATQVKEKFGGLRLYMNVSYKPIDDLISEATKKCYQTCESCGSPGTLHSDHGWFTMLCYECAYNINAEHKRDYKELGK